jgi:hypothetical protein
VGRVPGQHWADDPANARFALAPVYDMLPMRWRPDGFHGLQDYAPFEPMRASAGPEVRGASPLSVARTFWRRASQHAALSAPLRAVAAEMAARVSSR